MITQKSQARQALRRATGVVSVLWLVIWTGAFAVPSGCQAAGAGKSVGQNAFATTGDIGAGAQVEFKAPSPPPQENRGTYALAGVGGLGLLLGAIHLYRTHRQRIAEVAAASATGAQS